MEKNKKYRNHISVIFQKVIRTAGVAIFVFVSRFLTDMEEVPRVKDFLMILAIVLVCVVLSFVVHYVMWAKTYFYIQDEVLILEKNTLNKKKHTIGLKNISNVNLEQSLLQMALGTCTLKLDTNTLTTADKTDVSIVLKKKDAEQFRIYLLGQQEAVKEVVSNEKSENAFTASSKEILLHGLFSMNLLSLLVLAGAVASAWGVLLELKEVETASKMESILSVGMILIVAGGMAWKVVKEFLRYLEFSIERKEDKVYLQYGIVKRVAYSIPVEKINAVRLNQTMAARIAKRYMVEVVNVGMGNEEEEKHSFFLPYGKKEKIEEQLHVLLPEFELELDESGDRPAKGVFAVWLANGILWVGSVAIAAGIAAEFLQQEMTMVLAVTILIAIYIFVLRWTAYRTEQIKIGNDWIQIVQGHFGRYILFVKCEKIQFLTMKQCVIAKKYGIAKGQIHVLAPAENQIHNLPYMKEEKMNELKKALL